MSFLCLMNYPPFGLFGFAQGLERVAGGDALAEAFSSEARDRHLLPGGYGFTR